ncbi:Wax ester synthase/acyl-CoA:diacylglycerol acyltransferase [hydrothermal vent metagenome]|uniref:diacylglycerol O-acyltransferase n=1 Tax=hydrothermal vent metagenome TaxID=652676 RepID=A0A3B0SP76_9ZZZZ
MQQMQGLDATFVAFEQPNAPIHIGSVLIYDPATAPGGFVRFKDILKFIKGRLHMAPVMRRRMVKAPLNIDYPYWIEDPRFDLEYHVRHVALPKPGDWRQLNILAARNFARPLDLTRPPWEILVVEGLDNVEGVPKGSYAMLTKIHHAAIDGVSGVDLMQALHTAAPEIDDIPKPDPWKPERMPSQLGLLTRGYVRALTLPWRQAGAAIKSAPGMARAAKGFLSGDFDIKGALNTPRTRFNQVVSPHRVIDGTTFSLAKIKEMRRLVEGATVNDAVLSIVGGALRNYLIAHGDLPEDTLSAMAPISVRDESEKNTMGNQVSAMRAPLGTHIEDAVERLAFVHDETQKSKAMSNAMGARQMTEMSKVSPAMFMGLGARAYSQWGLANRMKPMFNTVVTNVPGPPIPIYSCGAKLIGLYGNLCLLDGVGLGHVVHSYVGEITIGVTACREAMPDPENYMRHLQQSYAAHLSALDQVEDEAA